MELPHRELTAPELLTFVRSCAASPDEWRHLVAHDPARRTYHELIRAEHLSLWLICWTGEQDTGFHDHDRSAGAVAVVQGRVVEERLALGRPPSRRLIAAGETFDFEPADIHRVAHLPGEPAVSLHAYSPRLERLGAYLVEPDGSLKRYSVSHEEELRPLATAAAI